MRDVAAFREQLARDLVSSARDLAQTFDFLQRHAREGLAGLVQTISTSVLGARSEAEGLHDAVRAATVDAGALQDTMGSMHDGAVAVAQTQEALLAGTTDQMLRLQEHLQYTIDTGINAALRNTTDLLVC